MTKLIKNILCVLGIFCILLSCENHNKYQTIQIKEWDLLYRSNNFKLSNQNIRIKIEYDTLLYSNNNFVSICQNRYIKKIYFYDSILKMITINKEFEYKRIIDSSSGVDIFPRSQWNIQYNNVNYTFVSFSELNDKHDGLLENYNFIYNKEFGIVFFIIVPRMKESFWYKLQKIKTIKNNLIINKTNFDNFNFFGDTSSLKDIEINK